MKPLLLLPCGALSFGVGVELGLSVFGPDMFGMVVEVGLLVSVATFCASTGDMSESSNWNVAMTRASVVNNIFPSMVRADYEVKFRCLLNRKSIQGRVI